MESIERDDYRGSRTPSEYDHEGFDSGPETEDPEDSTYTPGPDDQRVEIRGVEEIKEGDENRDGKEAEEAQEEFEPAMKREEGSSPRPSVSGSQGPAAPLGSRANPVVLD